MSVLKRENHFKLEIAVCRESFLAVISESYARFFLPIAEIKCSNNSGSNSICSIGRNSLDIKLHYCDFKIFYQRMKEAY